MLLRLTLDVNVWVNHYLSLAKGRQGSSAQSLVQISFAGHCRLGPVQPVLSHGMLDTLQEVLARLGLPEAIAEAARNAVEASAIGGVIHQAPHIVFGGDVQPIKDAEDGHVLDSAVAGAADLLVTHNMADFVPGPRADIDAEIIRADARGKADIALFRHTTLSHGLVIASVFAAKTWLVDGASPPPNILQRFRPNPPASTSEQA